VAIERIVLNLLKALKNNVTEGLKFVLTNYTRQLMIIDLILQIVRYSDMFITKLSVMKECRQWNMTSM